MALTFELPPEAESYRGGIRAFLAEHAPDGQYPADWTRRLADARLRRPALAAARGAGTRRRSSSS